MTTLNDINILRLSYEVAARKYNRRCRRLVALYTNGRKVDDNVILYNTDLLRMGYESTKRDLDMVIEQQAMIASGA